MKPLFVLLIVFIIGSVMTWLLQGQWDYHRSGKISLSVMLIFTAFGHFKFKKGMAMMLPQSWPAREGIIILTGLIEIAAAIGILIPAVARLTGILLIIFFIVILPANIYASLKKINIENGTYDGNGPHYLWFRIPLQLLFIFWTYWFVVR